MADTFDDLIRLASTRAIGTLDAGGSLLPLMCGMTRAGRCEVMQERCRDALADNCRSLLAGGREAVAAGTHAAVIVAYAAPVTVDDEPSNAVVLHIEGPARASRGFAIPVAADADGRAACGDPIDLGEGPIAA